MDIKNTIRKLKLIPHEEGGFYAETFQAETESLSHIYYLLEQGKENRLHKVAATELWLFHDGSPVTITISPTEKPDNDAEVLILSADNPMVRIPADTWQKAIAKDGPALVSCICFPSYKDVDHELR